MDSTASAPDDEPAQRDDSESVTELLVTLGHDVSVLVICEGQLAASRNMPEVRRIMVEAGDRFWGRLWRPLYDSLEGNPFAAMPSLHFGTSVMAARVLAGVGPGPAALGWTYALTLGFGLVYLGEHYVADLVAGFALADAVWRVGTRVWPSSS